ncbi:NAD-dependent deacetylase hst3 [Rhizina undulata]
MPTVTVTSEDTRLLQDIADSIARSKKSIVVTGAGISTNSGIPDFRSSDGLYNLVKSRYPDAVVKGRDLFDSVLFSDPQSTSLFYTFLASLRQSVLAVKDTTPTHKFIRTLSDTGRLLRCYTQNIDGLEEREGMTTKLSLGKGKKRKRGDIIVPETDQEKGCQVVQLHGDLNFLRCTQCHELIPYDDGKVESLLDGTSPDCPSCVGKDKERRENGKRGTRVGGLRPNIVLYGEEHPQADQIGTLTSNDLRSNPDLLIILGTSLKVHGLKRIVREFSKAIHSRGGKVIYVNNTAAAQSVWKNVIDYHVEMDCDAWVADVKKKRSGIWELQGTLDTAGKVVKLAKPTAGKAVKLAKPPAKGSSEDKENTASKKGTTETRPKAKATGTRSPLGAKHANEVGKTAAVVIFTAGTKKTAPNEKNAPVARSSACKGKAQAKKAREPQAKNTVCKEHIPSTPKRQKVIHPALPPTPMSHHKSRLAVEIIIPTKVLNPKPVPAVVIVPPQEKPMITRTTRSGTGLLEPSADMTPPATPTKRRTSPRLKETGEAAA